MRKPYETVREDECLRKQLSAKSRTRTKKGKKREIKGPRKKVPSEFQRTGNQIC